MTAWMLAQVGYSERVLEFFSFKYDFVRDALFASTLVGVTCGVVGVFLVLRGLSLLGDALGHATLPGLAIAFLLAGGLNLPILMLGALGAAFLSSLAVAAISSAPRTRPDAAIGIVLSVFFGAGIVLMSYIQHHSTVPSAGLGAMLLGNVAGITTSQLYALLVTSALTLVATIVFYRPLLVSTFDAEFARSTGLPVKLIHYGLLSMLALTVVVSVQAVGVVLVSAMLVIPASAGLFLARRLSAVLLASSVIGGVSGALGAMISYVFEGVATGPAMVLVASAFFGAAMLFGPRGGVVSRWWHRRTMRQEAAHV